MAAPSYTTDLQDFALLNGSGTVGEFTGMISGGSPVNNDGDDPIEGSAMASQTAKISASALASIAVDYGSGVSVPANGAVLIWHKFDAGGILESYTNGGVRAVVGSSLADWNSWDVGGSDVSPNPYGGWTNYPIDPTLGYDDTYGSPSGTVQFVGMAITLTATGPSKGNPHKVDAIRYGRCEARFDSGDSGDPATFAGYAAYNDSYRYGLIQAIPGGYQWKGLITIGYSGACYFVGENAMMVVQDCRKVTSVFNKIEVRNSSTFILNNYVIQALGTVSRGSYETISGTATWNTVNWVDCGTFVLASGDSLTAVTFRRCGQVTQNNAAIAGCTFARSYDTKALVADNISDISDTDFISAGTGYAIEGFSAAGSYDVSSLTFTDYAASDGSTGNEALHVLATSGTVTINYSGTAPSVHSDGATISKVSGQVTLTISAQVSLVGAEVRIYDLDDQLPDLGTELDGTESNPSSTFAFIGSASNVIWIQIMMDGYVEFGQQVTMPTASGDFVATLQAELNE